MINKQPARGPQATEVDEDLVASYLGAHPEFFERHSTVLARLRLPHQERGNAAVSLVERQVLVLREKNTALETKLLELIENGRANDAIVERMHRLSRRMLRARSATDTIAALDTSLREDFGASRWVVLLTDPRFAALAHNADGNVRYAARDSSELRIFESFLESARPRSGQIRDVQRDYLFGASAGSVGSSVLVPLGERTPVGLLAIASSDTERYLPTMSTDFLVRIGETVTEALAAYRA